MVFLPNDCRKLSVVLVLDLSKPEELWTTMEAILKQVTINDYYVHKGSKFSGPNMCTYLVGTAVCLYSSVQVR